jgi:hypothetical protein
MSEKDTKETFRPRTLMLATIELDVDNSLNRNLKELAKKQAQYKIIQ